MKTSVLHLLALLLFTFGVTGCASRMTGGVYSSPDGIFSCTLPQNSIGWHVDRQSAAGANGVIFTDDFGGLYRADLIDTTSLPSSFHSLSRQDQMKAWMDKAALRVIRSVCPGASIISKAYRSDLRQGAYTATINMPGGSTLVCDTTGRLDAVRHIMVFRADKWLVTAFHTEATFGMAPNTTSKDYAKELRQLETFVNSIQIKSEGS